MRLSRQDPHAHEVPVRQAARARPFRAVLLATISRVLLAVMLVLAVGAAVSVRATVTPETSASDRRVPRNDPPVAASAARSDATGPTQSSVVSLLLAALASAGARPVGLVIAAPRNGVADVRLGVMTPTAGPGDIERVLVAIEAAGVRAPSVGSIVPSAGGVRLDMVGSTRLSTARTPVQDGSGTGHPALDIAQLVLAEGATLERLEVPVSGEGAVQLGVRGRAIPLVRILAGIERIHSAPLRMREVRLEEAGDGALRLAVGFDLRPMGVATREVRE